MEENYEIFKSVTQLNKEAIEEAKRLWDEGCKTEPQPIQVQPNQGMER